jgi:hypothetical protein
MRIWPVASSAPSRLYPGSVHLADVGLAATRDTAIWTYAATNGFVLVTKDEDFQRLSLLQGAPPKVVWIGSATALHPPSKNSSATDTARSCSSWSTRRQYSLRYANAITRRTTGLSGRAVRAAQPAG